MKDVHMSAWKLQQIMAAVVERKNKKMFERAI